MAEKPKVVNVKLLERYPEFNDFRSKKNVDASEPSIVPSEFAVTQTPTEALENAYEQLRLELATDILLNLLTSPPALLEQAVVELLVKMGYGGSRRDAGMALGRSGDEGIDGVIKEDQLGLDNIYIQAKRWNGPVGRPEIQKFVGALHGQRARKGIFITTSDFTREAQDYVQHIESKIVLINGNELSSLMIDFGVGVTTTAKIELKKIDSDYFSG